MPSLLASSLLLGVLIGEAFPLAAIAVGVIYALAFDQKMPYPRWDLRRLR
jgi:hypothetical protein